MLYDPKWEAPTKTEPTFAGFIAWLEQQDQAASYNWCDGNCAIGQYLKTCGVKTIGELGYETYAMLEGTRGDVPGAVAMALPNTFGAALDRARKVAAGHV